MEKSEGLASISVQGMTTSVIEKLRLLYNY